MATIDRCKEAIGWLKLVFGALVAIDASLVGWLTENHATAGRSLLLAGSGTAAVVTFGIARVNQLAYRRLERLEDL